jgi:hypothetical protein
MAHPAWLSSRRERVAYWVFAAYAAAAVVFARGQDAVWAAWAAPAYDAAAVMLPRFLPVSRAGRRSP